MRKQLLKEALILLIKEVAVTQPSKPFSFMEPLKPLGNEHRPDFIVHRTFKMHVPHEIDKHLGLEQSDYIEGDIANFEHEIEINVDERWQGRHRSATLELPAEHPELDINDLTVVSIDGFRVGPHDAKNLDSYVGELTREEYDEIVGQLQRDSFNDREPNDFDDY